jgi:release factor glutamine methyltransferase
MSRLADELTALLTQSGIAQPEAEASRILQAAEAEAPDACDAVAWRMAEQRASGVPLAFVVGHESFMGIDLLVAAGALAPRQETELLGYAALEELGAMRCLAPRIIDMCCGSGNLACALARHAPAARIWASDLTDDCVALARRNTQHVGVADRVTVAQGDLFAGLAEYALEGLVDMVVANPPYISQGKLATDRAGLLEHEPRAAFDGGPYGLSIHQRIIKEAPSYLRPGGMLMFEFGLGQERQVKSLFERAKRYESVQFVADAAGQPRVASARLGAEAGIDASTM